MISWHRDFIPSTATASLTLATELSDRFHPASLTSIGSVSTSSRDGEGGASRFGVRRPGSTALTTPAAACTGRINVEAIAAIGERGVLGRPGVPFDLDAVFLTPVPGVAAVEPPAKTPSFIQAPGFPSFFAAISFSARANLSSSDCCARSPNRPTCFHTTAPLVLYAVTRHFNAAVLMDMSRASASFATSASALFPPLSTTSAP
eukprot:31380-Pelagococcus_subviridis.AAC.13